MNEDINKIKDYIEKVKEYIEYGLEYSEYLDLSNSFDEVLNLIKKQQAEIKNWEDHCTIDLEREITELNNKNFEYKAEIEKKDKIIDLMAKCMEIEGTGRRAFSCMFRLNEECNENDCQICIKQYFERKIEKGDYNA